jgi:hypothetical protein
MEVAAMTTTTTHLAGDVAAQVALAVVVTLTALIVMDAAVMVPHVAALAAVPAVVVFVLWTKLNLMIPVCIDGIGVQLNHRR